MDSRTVGQLILGFGGKLVALGIALYVVGTIVPIFMHALEAVRHGFAH